MEGAFGKGGCIGIRIGTEILKIMKIGLDIASKWC